MISTFRSSEANGNFQVFSHSLTYSLFKSERPTLNANSYAPFQVVVGKGEGIPSLHGPEDMVTGRHRMGTRTFLQTNSHIPSACILTLHPVILPIPYLVFSHLVKLTACILCFIFHSNPQHCCRYVCTLMQVRKDACL